MLTKFMRTRDGTPVVVLAQNHDFGNNRTVLVLHHDRCDNEDRISYRFPDGKHPYNENLDLVPYSTEAAATHIQSSIANQVFIAIKRLWYTPAYREHAVDIAVSGTDINRSDMHQYLKGLWG